MDYVVDTNAFWEVLREWNAHNIEHSTLLPLLQRDGKTVFLLPEICAMEI